MPDTATWSKSAPGEVAQGRVWHDFYTVGRPQSQPFGRDPRYPQLSRYENDFIRVGGSPAAAIWSVDDAAKATTDGREDPGPSAPELPRSKNAHDEFWRCSRRLGYDAC